jgi:hypothetical protein
MPRSRLPSRQKKALEIIDAGSGGLQIAASDTRQSNLRRCGQPSDLPDPPNQCGTRKGRGDWHGNPVPLGRRTVFETDITFAIDWYDPSVDGDVCPLTRAQTLNLAGGDLAGAVLSDSVQRRVAFRNRRLISHSQRRHVVRKTGKGRIKGADRSSGTYSFSYKVTIRRTR